MPFVAQPSEKCAACGRTVYETEKIIVEDREGGSEQKKPYHKNCLRCEHCNKVLSIGGYSSVDGQFYCVPHFKQLFATKGNYEEGFGKEKHASKWEAAPTGASPKSFIPETKEEKSSISSEKKGNF